MTATLTETTATTTVAQRGTQRLGTDISAATSIDEAIQMAGLNWGLNIVDGDLPFTFMTPQGVTTTSFPGMRLNQRTDNSVTLGVVGGRYQQVDNCSVFGLGQYILDQGGVPAVGGEFDHGRKVFMRFDLPGTNIRLLNGKDLISFGVTIKAAHDGTGNVEAALEARRLICMNGQTAKIKGIPHVFKVRHTASAEVRMREAQTILAGAHRYAKEFTAAAEHMLDTRMTPARFGKFIDGLYPEPSVDEKRAHTLWENRRAELLSLFKFAETNNLGRGTEWAAYNSVTEYLDWTSPVRTSGDMTVDVTRARRQFDGTNSEIKDRALLALAS